MFKLVASGPEKTAKGEPKFFAFAASNLKSEDYPHLESTEVLKDGNKVSVPVAKISPASIKVREYESLDGAKEFAISRGITEERFNQVILELLNQEERNDTIKVVRTRVTDAKVLPADPQDLAIGAEEEVNIFAENETRAGRVSLKEKQEKAKELVAQFGDNKDALADQLLALFGVKI